MGETGAAREARSHCARHHQRGAETEQRESGRPGRQRADSKRTKVHLLGSRAGPAANAGRIGNIVIRANPDGSLLRVKDIARIDLGAQTYNLRGRLNGQPAAILACYQLPGTNAVKAAQGVRKLMEEAKRRFPTDMDYAVSLDQ